MNYLYELGFSPAVYVVVQETIGTAIPALSPVIAALYDLPSTVRGIITAAVTLLRAINIGPVTVGGGTFASLYLYGVTPDLSYDYGSPGLSAILGYVSNQLTGALPFASTTVATTAAGNDLLSQCRTDPGGQGSDGPVARACHHGQDGLRCRHAEGVARGDRHRVDPDRGKDAL